MSPSLELVSSTSFFQNLHPWSQIEMIGIVEYQIDPKRFNLLGRETLDGSLRGHGHESR